MRGRLTLALLVSILLVGVASWSRFASADKAPAGLAAVAQSDALPNDSQETLDNFLTPRATTTPIAEKPLTGTDLVGHQLLLDYVGLAAGGGAGTESINALAGKYVDSIPTLNSAPTISYIDLKVVSNSKVNLENYANRLGEVYTKHSQLITDAYSGIQGTELDNSYYSAARKINKIYENTALELEKIPVPASIASLHLQLVNKHLSSAAAFKSFSEMEKDPMTAFAGLVALNKNSEEEIAILNEIDQAFKTNGT